MMLQDRLKRQRAVDKMQLAKVEREKQQEMEQVRRCYLFSIVRGALCVCVLCVLSVSLYEGAIGAQVAVDNSSSERLSSRFVPTPTSHFVLQELAARQEKIRRETIELEAQLRQKTELERVKMETEGRILAERKNHDLRLEQVCTCDVHKRTRANRRRTHQEGVHPPLRCDPGWVV